MPVVTPQVVEEWRETARTGTPEERQEAARLLEDAGTHHDLEVCLAAYAALREINALTAKAKLAQVIGATWKRAGGGGVSLFIRILLSVSLLCFVIAVTRHYTVDVRALAAGFTVLVLIGTNAADEGAKKTAQKELKQILAYLDKQPTTELAPLLPELKQVAALHGQAASLRKEASELVRHIETVLREEGALPLPAAPAALVEDELPRPVSTAPSEHPTPNT
jgi:hypothetical protein